MTNPPEYEAPRTETQRLADDIAKAMRDLRRDWDHMLRPGETQAPGRASTNGTALDDHSPSSVDTNRVTRTISLRRFAQDQLNAWSRAVMEDRDITNPKSLPLGTDVLAMAAFVATHADWISGQDYAPDCRDELVDLAHRCHLTAFPSRRESMSIGRCPLQVPGEADVLETCTGDVRYRQVFDERDGEAMAACERCGEVAVASWWAERMYLDGEASPLVTINELIGVIAYRLHITVTHEQVRQWKSRGKIEEAGRDEKGRVLFRHESVIDSIRADLRRRALKGAGA